MLQLHCRRRRVAATVSFRLWFSWSRCAGVLASVMLRSVSRWSGCVEKPKLPFTKNIFWLCTTAYAQAFWCLLIAVGGVFFVLEPSKIGCFSAITAARNRGRRRQAARAAEDARLRALRRKKLTASEAAVEDGHAAVHRLLSSLGQETDTANSSAESARIGGRFDAGEKSEWTDSKPPPPPRGTRNTDQKMPQIEPEPKQGAATPKSALKASMSEASSEPDPPATDSVFAALLAATHLQEYTTNLKQSGWGSVQVNRLHPSRSH
eukprot:SAG31_NODE_489_length_14938_cov_5.644113_16_plen_264_part_00